ncbi:hypothetical protein ONZ45_g18082 [Pleurotus djamor]|nr:hypothetical protein ONZ45_g18082 [Pleurotus djamor]
MSPSATPTHFTVNDAKLRLAEDEATLDELSRRIDQAEETLRKVVDDSKLVIQRMMEERKVVEARLFQTKALLSPIRRLPTELLRAIFLFNFEDYPCCAWVLAAIRLITTQQSSADTIRLWLERSGTSCPLDIEIFLRVSKTNAEPQRAVRASSPAPVTWPVPLNSQNPPYFIPPPSSSTVISASTSTTIPILPPAHTPIIIPPSPAQADSWSTSSSPTSERSTPPFSRSSMHWAHIAIFYLVEQMPRWERFVFRFDKQFSSAGALRSISGDAPLLKVFEVSSAESSYYSDWQWLPSASPGIPLLLPKLEDVTLQNTPFKWCSPIFQTNLRCLTLRALPTNHLSLDRILSIINANPNLEVLSLHFSGVQPPILPMYNTTLGALRELSIGGHYLLAQLVESLFVPSIENLSWDIEPRDPPEDMISNLLTRSGHPPLTHLSVGYGNSNSSTFYYGPGGIVMSWAILSELSHLQSFRIGSTPLEPLLMALGPPDEDSGQTEWVCPQLVSLGMKHCHAHSEGIAKLVQMVDARNPGSGGFVSGNAAGNVTPVKLRNLELYDCASLGQDVIGWLKSRVDEVVCTEPTYERCVAVNAIG